MKQDRQTKKPKTEQNNPRLKRQKEQVDERDQRQDGDVCVKAPEWAEHHRLHDEDEPCDDGRSGRH